MIYGYEDGNFWKVYNSYENCFQKFDFDYPFYIPMRYELIELNQLTPNEYAMKLLRNSKTGEIFLCDANNILHHIVDMPALIEYFGKNTELNQDWINLEPTSIEPLVRGEDIALPPASLSDGLKKLIAMFGSLISGKKS
jgi:hypothetical protein